MFIFRVQNAAALETALVRDFIARATEGFLLANAPFSEMVEDPSYAVLIGVEEDDLRSLAVVYAPEAGSWHHPQVLAFYNKGSTPLRSRMVDTIVEFAKSYGHDHIWAINQTGAPDSVWARMFRRAGEAKKIGSIMEVDFGHNRRQQEHD